MIMNGLSSFSYNMGVLVMAIVKSMLMGIPYVLVFLLFNVPVGKILAFYLVFILAGLAYAPFTLALSTLFSSPKLAIQISSIVYMLQLFVFLIAHKYRDSTPIFLVGLLPSTPLVLITEGISSSLMLHRSDQ